MMPRTYASVSSLKRQKRKMCTFYVMGSCVKGNSCNFAHGREELCEAAQMLAATRKGTSQLYDVMHDVARAKLELDMPMGMMQMSQKVLANAYAVDSTNVVTKATASAAMERSELLQNTQIPCLTIRALAEHKDATATRSYVSQDLAGFDSMSRASTSDCSGGSPWAWTSSRQTTADTDDAYSPSVVMSQVVVETQRGLTRARRNKFHKTRICEFFKLGKCRKRGACNFAHSAAELSSQPDLSFTKLCPSIVGDGTCNGVECTFAHDRSELRTGQAKQKLGPEASGPIADVAQHSLAGGSSYQLCVKNTFLAVEDPPETEVLKRASSAPGHLVPPGRICDEQVLWKLGRRGSRIVSEEMPQQLLANAETQNMNCIRTAAMQPRPSSPRPKAHIASSRAPGSPPRLA